MLYKIFVWQKASIYSPQDAIISDTITNLHQAHFSLQKTYRVYEILMEDVENYDSLLHFCENFLTNPISEEFRIEKINKTA